MLFYCHATAMLLFIKFKTFDDKLTQNDQWKTNKSVFICELFQ